MQVDYLDPACAVLPHQSARQRQRLIGGVIEYLHLEAVARVVDVASGLDDPLGHVVLVVDGKLDCDER